MENLSKRALRIGIIAGSMCICTAAYAAIPVIDDQNILQQLKTYEENSKSRHQYKGTNQPATQRAGKTSLPYSQWI